MVNHFPRKPNSRLNISKVENQQGIDVPSEVANDEPEPNKFDTPRHERNNLSRLPAMEIDRPGEILKLRHSRNPKKHIIFQRNTEHA